MRTNLLLYPRPLKKEVRCFSYLYKCQSSIMGENTGNILVSLEKKVNVQASEISFLRPELNRKVANSCRLHQHFMELNLS